MGNRITGAQDLADPRMSHAYGGTSQGFGGTSRSTLRSSWEMALIFDSGRIYGWGPRALRDEFPTLSFGKQ